MKHALRILAISTALTACDSGGTGPGSGRLEIHLAPERASYPVPDTVRAHAAALSADGTPVSAGNVTWRSITPNLATVSSSGLVQTLAPGTATIEAEANGITARVQIPIRGILHSAMIDVDETWRVADTPHVVRGYLNVGGVFSIDTQDTAVLTIESGVTVRFRPRSGLYFGDIEPGALVIPAGSMPVVMEGDSAARGSWIGISFEGPGRSELRNLTLRHCGAEAPGGDITLACLEASGRFQGSGPHIFFDGVTITDARDGANISHWVTITPGSRGLSINNTSGHVATVSPQVVAPFPRGGQFSGNAENDIRISNGLVQQSGEWAPAGLPWRLIGGVTFSGPADPVLVLPPGLTIRADPGGSFNFESGGLAAGAAGGPPVMLESTGSGWGGIVTAHGSQTALRNVILRDCGTASTACLRVDDTAPHTGLLVQEVLIRGARGAGIHFGVGARFHEQSSNLTITETAGVPLDLTPWGVMSIPGGNYTGNQTDAIRVRIGEVSQTATWHDPGVPYIAPDGIRVHSSIEPPTLTLEPGVGIRMGVGTTLSVDIGTLHAVGTATEPIVFSSSTPNVPGSWVGIELGTWGSPPTRLEHVEIVDAGAGPNGFSGALRLEADLGGVLRNSTIRRSSSCGIILLGGQWVDDYSHPAFGNSFVDVAGPALCRPSPPVMK